MTASKFTIENEPCFYINSVIIYRVIIFFWPTPYITSGSGIRCWSEKNNDHIYDYAVDVKTCFIFNRKLRSFGRCCNSPAVARLCSLYYRPTIFYPQFWISLKTEGFDSHPSRWRVCGFSCVSVCIYPRLVLIFMRFAAEIVMCLNKVVLSHTPLGMWRHILNGSWRALLPFYITNNAEFRNTSGFKIFVWGIVDLCKRNDRKWQTILVR
jgi:hypothetical protein